MYSVRQGEQQRRKLASDCKFQFFFYLGLAGNRPAAVSQLTAFSEGF